MRNQWRNLDSIYSSCSLASFVQGHNAKEEQFLASPHDMMIPIFLVAFQSGPRVYRVCYDLGIGHLAS